MRTPHIIKSDAVVAFVEGRPYTVKAGSLKYRAVLQAIQNDDDDAFVAAVVSSESETLAKEVQAKGFTVVNGIVSLDGVEVIGALQAKLQRLIAEELPLDYFAAFVRNLRKNPSRTAVKELYDFLAYAELPITEDGCFLAYKGVNPDGWSCTGGRTVLSHGKTDSQGRIYNGVGEVIRCERVEVDDDRRNACSNGLHVGSHDYATGFGSLTVVVKVNPADVVSVPLDCSCQKMRVCGYEVVKAYEGEMTDAVTTSAGVGVTSSRSALADEIDETIARLENRGGRVTLKRIQSALSPECPPIHKIRDIVANDLGFTVAIDPDSPTSVGSMFVAL